MHWQIVLLLSINIKKRNVLLEGKKNPLISALLLSAVSHCNVLAELDVSPLGKQCVLIQSQ